MTTTVSISNFFSAANTAGFGFAKKAEPKKNKAIILDGSRVIINNILYNVWGEHLMQSWNEAQTRTTRMFLLVDGEEPSTSFTYPNGVSEELIEMLAQNPISNWVDICVDAFGEDADIERVGHIMMS